MYSVVICGITQNIFTVYVYREIFGLYVHVVTVWSLYALQSVWLYCRNVCKSRDLGGIEIVVDLPEYILCISRQDNACMSRLIRREMC